MKLRDLISLDCTNQRMTKQTKVIAIYCTLGWLAIWLFIALTVGMEYK